VLVLLNHQVLGGEPMDAGVLGAARLAFRRFRAGAVLGVLLVLGHGSDLLSCLQLGAGGVPFGLFGAGRWKKTGEK
jgi:hypothetical protein